MIKYLALTLAEMSAGLILESTVGLVSVSENEVGVCTPEGEMLELEKVKIRGRPVADWFVNEHALQKVLLLQCLVHFA
jgi:hypothetical protein